MLKLLGNVIWFIVFGWEMALVYFLLGLIACITIILLPVGLQLFKLASLVMMPFGKEVRWTKSGGKMVLNVIWAIIFGWECALISIASGICCCITIVGIPAGLQMFKIAKLVLLPLGAKVGKK